MGVGERGTERETERTKGINKRDQQIERSAESETEE